MSSKIALFGAGGKMGVRLSKNLIGSPYSVRHVEPGAAGRQRLQDELGITAVSAEVALDGVDVVILAVPDTLIGKLAAEISPLLRAGTLVMTLDAAAPLPATCHSARIWCTSWPTPATPPSSAPRCTRLARWTTLAVSARRSRWSVH